MRETLELGVVLSGFMFPLQLAQMLFARRESHRDRFLIRIIVAEVLYLFCGVGIVCGLHFGVISNLHIAMYLIVYGCSVAVIKACYDISNIDLIFVTTCGYALQHLAYSVGMILWHYIRNYMDNRILQTLLLWLVQIMIFGVAYVLFIRKNEYAGERKERDPATITLAVAILFCTVCLSVWSSAQSQNGNETVILYANVICKFYAIVCCALVICMEYAISRMNMMNKQREFMEQLIHTQGSQFQLSQESISIINRKCHDIKYQMKALGVISNNDKRQEYLDEIRKAISIYDSVYHTGNETLNLLLREKTLLCEEYDIQFSCMADGEILLFIEPDDLYVLLGNALDNAIESVQKEEDIQKRVISMNIGMRQGIRCIHVENYCKEEVEFRDGLPLTTKQDKNYHGFGVQSIRFLTEKYHGDMVMQKIGDTFYLDILFSGK